jgi:hypothetical protein
LEEEMSLDEMFPDEPAEESPLYTTEILLKDGTLLELLAEHPLKAAFLALDNAGVIQAQVRVPTLREREMYRRNDG